ncbi:MAG: hypothetical protein HDS88_07635, partial [Bacteroidales bacterium]|nr:hypothetical protein [Bacteroidales bacterium]
MRNSIRKLTAVMMCVLAVFLKTGGVSVCGLDSYAQSPSAVGVPEDAYIFAVSGAGVTEFDARNAVFYSTKTQQLNYASRIWDSVAKKHYYYVKATENPVKFTLNTSSEHGFASITNSVTGKSISYNPKSCTISASSLNTDELIEIECDYIDNVRCGTLEINADNPSRIFVVNHTSGIYTLYKSDAFQDGKLTIKYDPKTEKTWDIAQVTGYGKTPKVYSVELDGNPLKRNYGWVSTATLSVAETFNYSMTLDENLKTHVVNVSTVWPDLQIPVSFKIKQDGGNETNDDYLQAKIQSLSVGGVEIDKSLWSDGKIFNVKNGNNLDYTLADEVKTQFVVNSRTLNGTEFTTKTQVFIEGDGSTTQEVVLNALVNNPVRFNVVCDNYKNIAVSTTDGISFPLTATTSSMTYGYDVNLPLTFRSYPGYQITQIKVGEKVYPVEKGNITINNEGMDAVYEVTCVPYERTRDFVVTVDPGNASAMAITLDPNGLNEKQVYLSRGLQTVKVNPADFPIAIQATNGSVYVDGEKQTPLTGGYYFAELPEAGKDIRIFNRQISQVTVDFSNMSGVGCTLKVDGKAVQNPESVMVLPGSVLEFTPASNASNLMLQTGNDTYVAASEGKFTYMVSNSCRLTLRPSAVLTVNFGLNYENFEITELSTGEKFKLTGKTTTILLPYIEGATATTDYRLKVVDPRNSYVLSYVTASPTTGFAFNDAEHIITVRNGMTVDLHSADNEKPYTINIRVTPQNSSSYSYNPETGMYYDNNGNLEVATQLLYVPNGYTLGGGFMEYEGEMVPVPYNTNRRLRVGDNNAKRDYSIATPNTPSWTTTESGFAKSFNLDESEFPIVIKNLAGSGMEDGGTYYSRYNLVEGGFFREIESMEEIKIEKPTDGSYEVNLIFTVEYENSYQWNFQKSDIPYYYQIDSNPEALVNPYDWTNNTGSVYSFSKVKIRPEDESKNIKKVVLEDYYGSNPEEIFPNADGEIVIYADPAQNSDKNVSVEYESSSLRFYLNSELSGYVTVNGNHIVTDAMTGEPDLTTIYGKTALVKIQSYSNTPYKVTRIVDMATGKALDYDSSTATLKGFEDGMELEVYGELYNRDKSIKIKRYSTKNVSANVGYSFNTKAAIYLNEGSPYESNTSLTNSSTTPLTSTVKYNDEDLPLVIRDIDFSKSGVTYQGTVFVNNQIVEPVNGVYTLPMDIEDGATVIVYRHIDSPTIDVEYTIDEDLKVEACVDNIPATRTSATVAAPKLGDITVKALEGNEFEYTAKYSSDGGATWSNFTSLTVALGYTQLAVKIEKAINTLTFNAEQGTDLSSVKVVTDRGEEYALSSSDNILELLVGIKSAKIISTVPDSYLTVVSSVSGMKFNQESGELTGLATGTLTVTLNKIVRENEVKFFVDKEEASEAALTFGEDKVYEKLVDLTEGFQTIKYGQEDLPLIYHVADAATFSTRSSESVPFVYVNGVLQSYSPEDGGYLFSADVLSGESVPVVKIYANNPSTVDAEGGVKNITLFYLVEPGITFKAIEDYSVEVTESGMREVLPSTYVELEAQTDNGEPLFVEVDGERVEATDGKYLIQTGNSDVTIAVKVEKLNVTVISEDAWQAVRVTGNGFSYPMYDATSELQFPASTTSLQLFTEMDGYVITNVIDDAGQAKFDAVTGELTNIKSESKLTLVMGEYNRDVELLVYVEDLVENNQISHVVLSEGKSVVKNVALAPGYQTVMIHKADLPLAVTTTAQEKAKVYVNNELLEEVDGKYQFPDELPAKSIVKIYSEEQYKISVEYTIDLRGYDFKVWHDRQQDVAINTADIHEVLPGTEISFTLTPQAAPEA